MQNSELSELDQRSAMNATWWPELDTIPSIMSWAALRERFIASVQHEFAKWISPDQAHFRDQLYFAVGRLDEGASLVRMFLLNGALQQQSDVLDIGSGNGGVSFAFANCRSNRVRAIDIVPNPQLRASRNALNLPVDSTVGDGAALPFADGSFDIVLLFDVFEHLSHPYAVGREVMRVLRNGGVCLVTTPPA